MGSGKQSIIEGGGKGKDNEAEVSGQALHVKVVAGGGGGPTADVNIAAVGGVAIGTTVPVSGTVSVVEPVTVDGTVTVDTITNPVTLVEPVSVDDNGGSLTIDGTVAVSAVGGTVTIQEPLSVDDGGGSLTVDFTQPVSTITPYARDAVVGADHFVWPIGLQRKDTLNTITPVDGDYTGGRSNNRGAMWVKHDGLLTVDTSQLENDVVTGAHAVFPAGAARDDVLGTLGVADGDWTDIRVNDRGALWIKPDGVVSVDDNASSLTVDGTVTNIPQRSSITNLVNAQTYNNTTTTTTSSNFDFTSYRYGVLYFALTKANTPTDIQMILEFTPDAGTTWCIWSVDQWTDFRYAAAQAAINEAIPLNHVTGKTMRLRVVATGTSATNTFTLSAWAEGIS